MSESSGKAAERSSARTAFVTWAHDDQAWEKSIATLVFALRQLGIAADVDLFHVNDIAVNWATYGIQAIKDNEFVLIAVSRAFKERWEGANNPRQGAGAAREANALKSIFDEDQLAFFKKIKILVLPDATVEDIPLELRVVGQRFEVSSFDLSGLEELLRTLTSQGTYLPPPVGSVPILPPKFMPDSDPDGSSLTNLQSRLAQLDSRLSAHADGDKARGENLDTERITVEAALETVRGGVRGGVRSGDAIKRPRIASHWSGARSSRVLAGSLSAALVLAVAMWLAFTSGGGASPRSTVRTGPLKLAYAHTWHAVEPAAIQAFPGLEIESPVSLAAENVSLEAGPVHNSAPVPGDPPSSLTAQIGQPSDSRTVSLGRLPAARYIWSDSTTGPLRALFVIATDTGDLALACQIATPTGLSRCAAVAMSAQVTGIRVLSPGRQPTVDREIQAALAPNLAARRKRAELASSRAEIRAATAHRLAAADASAAASLSHLSSPMRFQAAIARLSLALRHEAESLAQFARAVDQNASGPYRHAHDLVDRASRSLATTLLGIRGTGFVRELPRLHVPSLPVLQVRRITTSTASPPVPSNAIRPTSTPSATAQSPPAQVPHSSPKKHAYGPVIVTEPSG